MPATASWMRANERREAGESPSSCAIRSLATRITVLTFGRVLATGTPAEIRANPHVQEAYLGA